jgi:hypothetical protein
MKRNATLLCLLITLVFTACSSVSAEIIIVNETKPQLYALHDVVLSGDLNTNILTIKGSGEVIIGENVKVYLFGKASDVLVESLDIAGKRVPVSFDESGYFFVAEEGVFDFTGTLKIRTPGQVRLFVHGPMNELKFDINNGYAIGGDQYGLYEREVIIQRSEKVATLVTGSFKYTYAERDEFQYVLDYKSFGASLGRHELVLNNNENVLSVVGAKDYALVGNKLVLELEGSEAHVSVSGIFDSNSLRIPLKEGKHHVLIESDPEKKITVSTTAKEVDVSESPLRPTYSNARAFLASWNEVFTITVKVLGMYPSLAASVGHSSNRIAITDEGSMLGELTYRYSNTGVDYIQINAPGTPLYASAGYKPVKLTKEDDKLFLSFPKTSSGTLDMIYFDSLKPLGIMRLIDVPVANTVLPVTTATTQIYLPKEYFIIETFGAAGGSELPELKSIILFVLVIGGLGYGMKNSLKYGLLYTIYTGGLFYFDWRLFVLSVVVSIILVVRRHVSEKSIKWMLAGAGVLIALCLAVVVLFSLIGSVGVFSMGAPGAARNVMIESDDYEMVQEAAAPAVMTKSMSVLGRGEGAISAPVREGVLPVKLELPRLGKTVTVTNHLVTKENPVELKLLIVAGWLKYLGYLLALLCGGVCYRTYRKDGG